MTTVNPVGSGVDSDFASFLTECDVYAQRGYWIASNHEKVLSKTLREAEEKVQQAMDEIAVSLLRAPETTQNLRQQLLDIQQAFYKLSFAFQEDLNGLHERLSKFSITLFGRTMAGKSTLIHIITELPVILQKTTCIEMKENTCVSFAHYYQPNASVQFAYSVDWIAVKEKNHSILLVGKNGLY